MDRWTDKFNKFNIGLMIIGSNLVLDINVVTQVH